MPRIAIILALPIEYNTSSMIRCKSIIEALGGMGHEIICYCPKPDKNHKYYSNVSVNLPGTEIIRYKKNYISSDINEEAKKKRVSVKSLIKRIALNCYRKFDLFGSSIRYVSEKKWISEDIRKRKADILLSFSDPKTTHIIGSYCKKNNKTITYIQQWGDPLAMDITGKSILPLCVKKFVEKSLIKSADKICYVSPVTLDVQKKLYGDLADKMEFLPTPSMEYEELSLETDDLCLGYFGSYNSVARNILPFYEAAKNNPEISFYIIGDSDIKLDSVANVHIVGRMDPKSLEQYFNKVQVIVCLMNKKGSQIPGKIYHDASTTKDILLIKDGECADIIQSFFEPYNHYTFVDNDIEEIDKAIKHYITNGIPKRSPVEDFKAENIAYKLIAI